jgi:hypothetical protein
MRKAVVIAVCAAAVVAAAWWWMAHDRVSSDKATSVPDAKGPSAAQLTTRAERIRRSIEEHRHLWREASYIEIRQLAQDGNLVAQRRLSEVYEDCAAYNGAFRSSFELLPQLGKVDTKSAAASASINRDYNRLCTQATVDMRKNSGLALYWLHKSAKSGDVVSEMRYFSRSVPTLSHTQYQYFIDKVRQSGEPDAIFELSLLLPKLEGKWPDPMQAPAFEGQTAEQAWISVACRAGYDCARGSRLMNFLCLSMLLCSQDDYEGYLADSSADSTQRGRRQQQVALIEREILAPKAK